MAGPHVFSHRPTLDKCLGAIFERTGDWLFTLMAPQVTLVGFGRQETFGTELAGVWFLPCVTL